MAQFKEVNPELPVRDVSKAVEYYVEKLGYQLNFRDSPANPRYAGIARDHVKLHL